MSHTTHKADAPHSIRCFVLTISDTRTDETDASGRAIADLLTGRGHLLIGRAIVKDDAALVRDAISNALALARDQGAQVIISTGGTGITSRDTTYEAISALLEKRLDGFGELFRMLSYQDIGAAAMMSRAVAGLVEGRIVIALPGSEAAVRLAMEKLVLPEIGHLVQQASK
jgi:molybdenum cofactor biosynthesis protein B